MRDATPAREYPGALSQPLAYPGRRPGHSFLYLAGYVHRLHSQHRDRLELWLGDGTPLDELLRARGAAPLARRRPVLAIGSNACPGRLLEKYGAAPAAAVPVLAGELADIVVVYSRRPAAYAALPATWLRQPGTRARLAVTLLDNEQLALMDRSEGVGSSYARVALEQPFELEHGPPLAGVSAYLDRRPLALDGLPVRLAAIPQTGVDWPALDQRQLLGLVLDRLALLPGLTLEERHRRLAADPRLLAELAHRLEAELGGLELDPRGRLRPSG